MAKSEIFCIGIDVPGDEFQYFHYDSDVSLLDADIILFEVDMDYCIDYSNPTHQGRPSLTAASSVENRRSLKHWRKQLNLAFDAGKTIFVFLRAPVEVFAHTGTQEFSGTGRNQRVINIVGLIDSYMAVPLEFDLMVSGEGKKVSLTQEGRILASYWQAVKDISYYEILYEHKESSPLMVTKSGNKTIASLFSGKSGNMLLLPPINFSSDDNKALRYGKSFLKSIVEVDKSLRCSSSRGPVPEWALGPEYQLEGELKTISRIEAIDDKIRKMGKEREKCEIELEHESLPKCLLSESGKALEAAIIDALKIIGFKAEGYVDDESEFDIVFESSEGRFLGEAEGKDNSSINIKKLQQLERNIQEDFAKDHVKDYAKGVLFGNPARLTKPDERKALFTKKALSAAKRSGLALVNTPDLFPIIQYLKRNKDESFCEKVRACFKDTSGDIIVFPSIPNTEK